MDYIDFQVKIGPRVAEGQYTVWVRTSLLGEARGVFVAPLTDEQLELFVLKVGLARRGMRRIQSPEWRASREFGQKLFRALFTDEIRAAYLGSHNEAVRAGKGLCVKLTLEAPVLTNYPWEFLYDPSSSQFLSLFEDTPILRYIELARPILPLTVTPPLRILVMASSPLDYEPLDLARERRNLTHALAPLTQAGLIEVDWLATPTLDALREQLLKRPYHIFHFIGHGGYDESEQDGTLIFENANRYSNRVSGERCAVILGNHRTLRLAVLNACEGARTSQQDPFAEIAASILAAQTAAENLQRTELLKEQAAAERAAALQRAMEPAAADERAAAEQRAASEQPAAAKQQTVPEPLQTESASVSNANSAAQTPVIEPSPLVRSGSAHPDRMPHAQEAAAAATAAATIAETKPIIEPAATTPLAQNTVWAWLAPLAALFDYRTGFVFQIAIINFLVGLIAPLVGIFVLRLQLNRKV